MQHTLAVKEYYKETSFDGSIIGSISDTLQQQATALTNIANNINQLEYQKALTAMYKCRGHVIISGMGKSGHIGRKIAATLASTGTPSFFIHPAEAFHGDLGMITAEDVVVLISNSGETDEVLQLIPSLKSFGNTIISITNCSDSTMAKNSDAVLELMVDKESCPNNLAPTTSTTLTLAIGDALAVALMHKRGFEPNDFARFHPGGSLGRRLLTRVKDEMVKENLPVVSPSTGLMDTVFMMTIGKLGLAIVEEAGKLVGIITDGDLRRAFGNGKDLNTAVAEDIMTNDPITISKHAMLVDAEELMRSNCINDLLVVNDHGKVVGVIGIYS